MVIIKGPDDSVSLCYSFSNYQFQLKKKNSIKVDLATFKALFALSVFLCLSVLLGSTNIQEV